ncbi:MAG: mandelate racemase/muconate lactonizing enzyme family protein [Chloroflexi bacterium]|jgi:L-alanine-DL-glutamate epimerase-like enolase superfamily enzyme|nr:mandelate racemase/muconate lactonizing enzyme family protein [Chloroflexota bacterium]MBT4074006.1 mandelate racemase/muconate lactonizing enzyme family protein [Chloroflexota bacterium]MBT4516206.1 mandelate racemase/muconate lactonizing enzyme family protein [Chloroflexota bacterium]MBT6682067.1 mandelate racemase/muconate lactonizing enzyme family protein [Chloroflexota bacterium]
MKITDLKCAIIGRNPVVRITTDEGIEGIGQAEPAKENMKWLFMFYRDMIVGMDPTDVERVMQQIRRLGAFKPWGAGVSTIEMALWDIAGKAAGVPVYKLLGGKVRDRVRTYNGNVRRSMSDSQPEDYAEEMRWMKARPEGFSIIKQGISFHGSMVREVPDYFYGDLDTSNYHPNKGLITERGMKHTIACIEAMKDVLGDEVGLALDCGPGFGPTDALKLAKSVEHLNVMWLEDMITGDYTPYVLADLYREVTPYTTTPIHTGEQIYLRQNFMGLIEKRAVNIIGPDLADVGGLAELKWIAEYADLHGISIAPHGTGDGLIGLAAQVQVAATLPKNYIGFEYCTGDPDWWYDIVEGLPNPIVKDSFIDVWDTPGLGVTLNAEATKKYLREEDSDFFD